MAKFEIVKIGDEVLRAETMEVKRFDQRLHKLIDDMAETMYAEEGCGLAAPQVGISKKIVVVDVGEGLIELINPVIVERKGEQLGPEGCLSIPGKEGLVNRAKWVKVEAQDRNGNPIVKEGEDYLARAFQHEIDHLNGVLYIDRVEKQTVKAKRQKDVNEA